MDAAELVCRQDDAQWLSCRQQGVTATDIGAIAGVSPYESEYSLHLKKRGLIPDEDIGDDDRMRLGRYLEPYVRSRWIEETGRPVGSSNVLWRSTVRRWQLSTVDGLSTGLCPVECKTWADADRWRWENGPPARIRMQAIWQADTMGVSVAEVAVVFLPSGEFQRYPVTVDSEEITWLRRAAEEFMQGVMLERTPTVDGSAATISALRAFYNETTMTRAEVDPVLWSDYLHAKSQGKKWEEITRINEACIREQVGNARAIEVNGIRVGTHVTGKRNYFKVWEKP